MIYHRYLAVTGRIHGDDEDTCLLFEEMTEEQAREAFRSEILAQRISEEAERKGVEVYINYVLASQAPIEILAYVYAN